MFFHKDFGIVEQFNNDLIKKLEQVELNFKSKKYFNRIFTLYKKYYLNEQIGNIDEYLKYININNSKVHRDKMFNVFRETFFYNKNEKKLETFDTKTLFDIKTSNKIKLSIENHLK